MTSVYGVSVTTCARTVIDLARTLPFMDAVVVADSALRAAKSAAAKFTKEELRRVCDACERWPGIGQAKHVVAFSDGRAESVLESCPRVVFDKFRLEPPELQATIRGPGFAFRVDFRWERYKTIVETDGLAKYKNQADLLAQFRRDRLLRDAGYKVVHITWHELFDTPAAVIARVQQAQAAPAPY